MVYILIAAFSLTQLNAHMKITFLRFKALEVISFVTQYDERWLL
jgi:type III secretory pathway component EscR